jgi:hypothetical protein
MGGFNHPEVEQKAAQEPLNAEQPKMALSASATPHDLREVAGHALNAHLEGLRNMNNERQFRSRSEDRSRHLPNINTSAAIESAQNRKLMNRRPSNLSEHTSYRPSTQHSDSPDHNRMPVHPHRHSHDGRLSQSPDLRHQMMPLSALSPHEQTLPPMHPTPPLTSKSHSYSHSQSLPSIKESIGALADVQPPSAGHSTHRSYDSVLSPPASAASLRPPLSAMHPPTTTSFSPRFPPSERSPVTSLSEPSPREGYHNDPQWMVQHNNYPQRHFSIAGTPQNDVQVPDSHASHTTNQSQQSRTSMERLSLDGGGTIILPPPVPSGDASAIFHCDHPGCLAPPFATQYLLK